MGREFPNGIAFCNLTILCRIVMLLSVMKSVWANKVDLAGQRLDTVPRNLDIGVTELDLRRNVLTRLNAASFDLYTMLTKLDLSGSHTEVIEDRTFENQDKLVSLDLYYCPIKQLPQVFGPSVYTLEEWTMGHAFDPAVLTYPYFAAFEKLRSLYITGVDIGNLNPVALPPNIGWLCFGSSDMSEFPNISNSLQLWKIRLKPDTQIESIPQEHILNLPRLYDIELERNRLTYFPNVSHLKGLIHIVVQNNRLSHIPTEHIAGLPLLRDLYFASNIIQSMPNVSHLRALKTVYLGNNLIPYVPESCLWGLPALQVLDLQFNQMTSIGDISHVTGSVYLHGNQLSTLPAMYNLQLSEVTLRDNPWYCNVSLCWLRMLPWMKTPPVLDTFSCTEPSERNGTLVMRVHPIILNCYDGRYRHYSDVTQTSWRLKLLAPPPIHCSTFVIPLLATDDRLIHLIVKGAVKQRRVHVITSSCILHIIYSVWSGDFANHICSDANRICIICRLKHRYYIAKKLCDTTVTFRNSFWLARKTRIYFHVWPLAWKHQAHPCFCMFPLEFGSIFDMYI